MTEKLVRKGDELPRDLERRSQLRGLIKVLEVASPKTNTQTQTADEMDIDNSNKGDELDSSL